MSTETFLGLWYDIDRGIQSPKTWYWHYTIIDFNDVDIIQFLTSILADIKIYQPEKMIYTKAEGRGEYHFWGLIGLGEYHFFGW